jgi:hypothetical protein
VTLITGVSESFDRAVTSLHQMVIALPEGIGRFTASLETMAKLPSEQML